MGCLDGFYNSFLSPFPHQGMPLPLPPSPVLLLPEVGPEDEGTYSCVATHPSHRPRESPAVSISIIGKTPPQIQGPWGGKGCRRLHLPWQDPPYPSLSAPTSRPPLSHPNPAKRAAQPFPSELKEDYSGAPTIQLSPNLSLSF
jgi:hypothetical protein